MSTLTNMLGPPYLPVRVRCPIVSARKGLANCDVGEEITEEVPLRPLTSLKWPYVPEESAYPDPLKRDDPKPLQMAQYETIGSPTFIIVFATGSPLTRVKSDVACDPRDPERAHDAERDASEDRRDAGIGAGGGVASESWDRAAGGRCRIGRR